MIWRADFKINDYGNDIGNKNGIILQLELISILTDDEIPATIVMKKYSPIKYRMILVKYGVNLVIQECNWSDYFIKNEFNWKYPETWIFSQATKLS